MEALKRLIAKKKADGHELSPGEKLAKSAVLGHLMDDMDSMGADKIQGLKKVTVAAPDKKGLEHGLKEASDLVEKGPLHSEDEDDVSDHGDDENEQEPHDFHDEDVSSDDEEEKEDGNPEEGDYKSEEEAPVHHSQKAPEEMDEHELHDHINKLKQLHAAKKSHFGM